MRVDFQLYAGEGPSICQMTFARPGRVHDGTGILIANGTTECGPISWIRLQLSSYTRTTRTIGRENETNVSV